MTACTCTRYRIAGPAGEILEGELERDPDCRQHGFPTSDWPAGHPLRRHCRGNETPRETEARLYQESLEEAAS